jgi:hypothetical protein
VKLFLDISFPSLNETIGANRTNRYTGAKLKRRLTALVAAKARDIVPLSGRHDWIFTWHEKDRRRDPDNISIFSPQNKNPL